MEGNTRNDLDQHSRAKSVPLDELTNTLTSHFAKTTLLQFGKEESDEEEEDESQKEKELTDADDETQTQDEEEGSPMFTGGFIDDYEEKQLSIPSKQSLVTYTLATNEKRHPHHFDYSDTLASHHVYDEVNKLKEQLS